LVAPAFGDALDLEETVLYFVDLNASREIFAGIQLHEEFKKKIESGDMEPVFVELLNKGSASVFLSETTKFAERLRKENVCKLTLTMMYFDTEDDNPPFLSERHPSRPEGPFQSGLYFGRPEHAKEDTPAVVWFINHRRKDPKEKRPVTVHCSFVLWHTGKVRPR
jgi:hypothetical protein